MWLGMHINGLKRKLVIKMVMHMVHFLFIYSIYIVKYINSKYINYLNTMDEILNVLLYAKVTVGITVSNDG